MNQRSRVALVSPVVLALAACTAGGPAIVRADPQAYPADAPRIVHDAEYIARVERSARRRGVQLQWVNVPNQRVDRD